MNISKRMPISAAQTLLNDLESKKKVSGDMLERILGPHRWERLQNEINAIREAKYINQPLPSYIVNALRPYTERLTKADRLSRLAAQIRSSATPSAATLRRRRMRGLSSAKARSTAQLYSADAEFAYDRAIEKLLEIIEEFPEVGSYLDRLPVFDGEHCNVSPDPAGVPRLRSSRSRYNIAPRAPRQSIRSLRIEAIRDVIRELVDRPQQ